jgi:lipopolysaccharide export LptBFGC system permease protein LptF
LLKTLHAYLLKDLLKVTLLTLVALTLLMSVLAIIQPLRKLGLAGEQLLQLFLYTIPVMLSLTLPVATLFASTLVYGRFSQDNELLAARASGISTLSLLRPALGMGLIVTVLSLAMINLVAPKLSSLASLVQENIRQIFFHQLKSRGYADFSRGKERHVIHADAVDLDANGLEGIVYVVQTVPPGKPAPQAPPDGQAGAKDKQPKRPGVTLAWAAWAGLDFTRDANGDDEVVIRAVDPSLVTTGTVAGLPVGTSRTMEFVMPLDNPIKEKTSFYSWTDLLETLRDPSRHSAVRREMTKIRQGVSSDMLAGEIAGAIQAGRKFTRFAQGDERFEIEAAWAEPDKSGTALKSVKPDGKEGKLVTVTISRADRISDTVTARQGQVILTWSRITDKPQITIKLNSDVTVNYLGVSPGRVSRPATWTRGEMPLPQDILTRANAINLSDLRDDPRKLTGDPKVLSAIDRLKNTRIPQLRNDLIAELHVRVAYGASCFLMVAMGAALGLMFRGGQFISAFALSAVPAAAVIIMLLMGKAMVRNPAAGNDVLGLACIWGGIAALLVANLVIYARLARK